MYQYIKGTTIHSEEHMLSATEIARVLDIYHSNPNKLTPNSRLISAVVTEYQKAIKDCSEYYYMGGRTLRVFPKDIWVPAIRMFLAKQENEPCLKIEDMYVYTCSINNKKYNYLIKKETK